MRTLIAQSAADKKEEVEVTGELSQNPAPEYFSYCYSVFH
jgi:hypothetical protein